MKKNFFVGIVSFWFSVCENICCQCHCRLYKILTCLCCLHITVNYFTALYNFFQLLQSFWNCVEVLTLFLCFLWMIMFFLSFALSAQTADRFRENARDFVSFEYATTWAGVSQQMLGYIRITVGGQHYVCEVGACCHFCNKIQSELLALVMRSQMRVFVCRTEISQTHLLSYSNIVSEVDNLRYGGLSQQWSQCSAVTWAITS